MILFFGIRLQHTLKCTHVLSGLLSGFNSSSSDDDDDDDDESSTKKGSAAAPAAVNSAQQQPKPTPEGLPAGFFDDGPGADAEPAEPSSETVRPDRKSLGVENDGGGSSGARPAAAKPSGKWDPARAAELAAEAAALEEADELRVREAAARAVAAARATGSAVGGADAEKKTDEEDSGDTAAPNGSALPEGFFDDPKVMGLYFVVWTDGRTGVSLCLFTKLEWLVAAQRSLSYSTRTLARSPLECVSGRIASVACYCSLGTATASMW